MTNIYTYRGDLAERRLTLPDLQANKAAGHPMTQVNAFTFDEAEAAEASGIDILSVTSLLTEDIRAGAPNIYLIATMGAPHLVTADDVQREAFRAAQAGADQLYTIRSLDIIEMLAKDSFSVQGHVGLVPRLSVRTGGLRAHGKTADEVLGILEDIRRLENAGAVAVEVECVAAEAMTLISQQTPLITHAIGSGTGADVTFMFTEDICGDNPNPPRHARAFGDLRSIRDRLKQERRGAMARYAAAVQDGAFPDARTSVSMLPGEHEKLLEELDRRQPVHR